MYLGDVCFSVVNSVVLYKQIHCQNRREAGCCGSDAFYSFGAGVSLVSVASIPFYLSLIPFIFYFILIGGRACILANAYSISEQKRKVA